MRPVSYLYPFSSSFSCYPTLCPNLKGFSANPLLYKKIYPAFWQSQLPPREPLAFWTPVGNLIEKMYLKLLQPPVMMKHLSVFIAKLWKFQYSYRKISVMNVPELQLEANEFRALRLVGKGTGVEGVTSKSGTFGTGTASETVIFPNIGTTPAKMYKKINLTNSKYGRHWKNNCTERFKIY